jgi:hypothetical protein
MFKIREDGEWVVATVEDGTSPLNFIVEGGGRAFMRNAMRPGVGKVCWLVGELNGVRVYLFGDGTILMTDKDVYYSDTVLDRLANDEYKPWSTTSIQ